MTGTAAAASIDFGNGSKEAQVAGHGITAGVLAALAFATPAVAAPDRTIVLSSEAPVAEFTGGPFIDFNDAFGTAGVDDPGGPVGADYTLFDVRAGGRFTVQTSTVASPGNDIDLTIYRSDASGTKGARLTQGFEEGTEERQSILVKAGWYLLRAGGYPAAGATYEAKADLAITPAAVPAPAAPSLPVTTPAKPAAPKKLSCRAKAKKLKNAKKRRTALRRCARGKR